MRKTIFVVDDNDTNLTVAESALEAQYNVMTMASAQKMFVLLERIRPQLILLDIKMPEMDGFETLSRLKASKSYVNIPVIFLTAVQEPAMEVQGFEMGAVDFILKPFSVPVLLNRIRLHIDTGELIRKRTEQLERFYRDMILVLSDVVESRDKNTGGHIERTTQYIKILVKAMWEQDLYLEHIQDWDLETVGTFALLHDVGKISVSDTILNKPGRLTLHEFEDMKQHTLNAEKIIDKAIARIGEDSFLHNAKLFAVYHHENWDGSGYPYGLSGEEIPIQGRIMAIADVYDALVSERPYKPAYSADEAVRIIMDGVGKRFDPQIAAVFYGVRDLFNSVRMQNPH